MPIVIHSDANTVKKAPKVKQIYKNKNFELNPDENFGNNE